MKLVATLIAIFGCSVAAAEDIASCSNPVGKGYYPQTGIVDKEGSGWNDERISGGITKVSLSEGSEFDVLFVDSRNEIISSRQDGGHVLLLNRGASAFSLLVVYPGKTAEVYTFIKDDSGELEYLHVLSRAGDGVLITKSSVMRGDCSYINFDAIPVAESLPAN
jgi:hypothetical protein